MEHGLCERRGDERQRSEQRDRVPVHGADEAGEPVETHPCPPVQPGLERRERKHARGVEANGVDAEPPETHPWGNAVRPQALPLADAEKSEPEGRDRNRRSETTEMSTSDGPPAEAANRFASGLGWASSYASQRATRTSRATVPSQARPFARRTFIELAG
jgi:hypothetical protein